MENIKSIDVLRDVVSKKTPWTKVSGYNKIILMVATRDPKLLRKSKKLILDIVDWSLRDTVWESHAYLSDHVDQSRKSNGPVTQPMFVEQTPASYMLLDLVHLASTLDVCDLQKLSVSLFNYIKLDCSEQYVNDLTSRVRLNQVKNPLLSLARSVSSIDLSSYKL